MREIIQKGRPLRAGEAVGVLATGSPLHEDRFQLGAAELERRGFSVKAPIHPGAFYGRYDHGFANGAPEERARALHELLRDESVGAIITARGGYGTLDLLPLLDLGLLEKTRKLIVGLSDVTALLIQSVRVGIPSVHGPTVGTSFADYQTGPEAARGVDSLMALLTDKGYRFDFACEELRAGAGEGRIIAGNLSMLTALFGTPWDISYDGSILVLEEVGEAPFRVHRAFTQLKLAGKLNKLAGLVLGRFSKCTAAHGPTVDEVLRGLPSGILSDSDFPILAGLPLGHWGENQPVPLGCRARIEGGRFVLLESPLEVG